ncbi:MAG: MotA/TolQ/ExbB proton channel family protein [Bacteroidota bacterium]
MADETNKPTTSFASEEVEIKAASPFRAVFPVLAIIVLAILAHVIFYQGFGNPVNFENGETNAVAHAEWEERKAVFEDANPGKAFSEEEPAKATDGEPANLYGLIFKGGFVIPIGMTLTLVLFCFVIERGITIFRASGKGNTDVFVKKVRRLLHNGDLEEAADLCDRQAGSVGNVIKAGLRKYREMEATHDMDKEQKKSLIQGEIEEATMLELPMLERNLSIISTTASLGTLVGLIGTVLGMIRAFSALGEGGAPNAAELSVGISEALINTALGITTSALSILAYNFFTTKIDGMTYAMDEAGYSIVQTFDARN